MTERASLLTVLISVMGGGTIVPLVYTVFTRLKSKEQDDKRARVEIEGISAHAAREAVQATDGALKILSKQLHEGREREIELEGLCQQKDAEIARLKGSSTTRL